MKRATARTRWRSWSGWDTTEAEDIGWDAPLKEDPLKLHQFLYLIPPYTQDAKEQWRAFRVAMGEARRSMDEAQEALDAAQQAEARRIRLEMMSGKKRASPVAIRHTLKFITYGRHEELLAENEAPGSGRQVRL